jgi:hypothetical protein
MTNRKASNFERQKTVKLRSEDKSPSWHSFQHHFSIVKPVEVISLPLAS